MEISCCLEVAAFWYDEELATINIEKGVNMGIRKFTDLSKNLGNGGLRLTAGYTVAGETAFFE